MKQAASIECPYVIRCEGVRELDKAGQRALGALAAAEHGSRLLQTPLNEDAAKITTELCGVFSTAARRAQEGLPMSQDRPCISSGQCPRFSTTSEI